MSVLAPMVSTPMIRPRSSARLFICGFATRESMSLVEKKSTILNGKPFRLALAAVPVAVVNWISPLTRAAGTIDGFIITNSAGRPSSAKKPIFAATMAGK